MDRRLFLFCRSGGGLRIADFGAGQVGEGGRLQVL